MEYHRSRMYPVVSFFLPTTCDAIAAAAAANSARRKRRSVGNVFHCFSRGLGACFSAEQGAAVLRPLRRSSRWLDFFSSCAWFPFLRLQALVVFFFCPACGVRSISSLLRHFRSAVASKPLISGSVRKPAYQQFMKLGGGTSGQIPGRGVDRNETPANTSVQKESIYVAP